MVNVSGQITLPRGSEGATLALECSCRIVAQRAFVVPFLLLNNFDVYCQTFLASCAVVTERTLQFVLISFVHLAYVLF